jgi:hypothetical protein
MTAFLDLAPEEHEEGLALWEALTGYRRSATRGPADEFVSLLPTRGDDYLRVQRLGSGASRVHLDLHVEDPFEAAGEAVGLGARVVADHGDYLTLTSPGGFTFCLVVQAASQVPAATDWPSGRSRADQVCLDIGPSAFDAELAFWQALTGWPRRSTGTDTEFARLAPPAGIPLQLLLQRLDDEEPAVRAHLDWCAADRDAEVQRHVDAGATLVERFDRGWTVLRAPAGFAYCVTARPPQED